MLRHTLPPHGKVPHRPVKKQAVNSMKASMRKIVTRNMSRSPLLRLAPEIREMIWKAAIGNRTIHIKHFSAEQLKSLQRHQTYPEATEANGAFRHIECVATTTEEEAYIASKTQNTRVPAGENSAYYVQSYKSRHYNCYQLENGAHGKNAWVSLFEQGDYLINEKDRITLCTMLGTCRQIYGEAYRIFWLTNAFSFADPFSFREFLGSLTLSQKQHLTNLQICERLNHLPGAYGFEWEDTLRRPGGKSIIDLLSGVRTFNLCFEQRFNTVHSFNAHISAWEWLSNLSQPWLALRPAPLANVTVIISDKQSSMQRSGLMHLRCTVQRKSEIAEEIRNNIIDETQVAKARQDISDKRAAQKKRYRELKQMKQAEDILKDEINSTAEITHAQVNEVSREVYGSMYDGLPKEHDLAVHLLGEPHSSNLTSAHTSYSGSLSFHQAPTYLHAHEPQQSPNETMSPSFDHFHGGEVAPQAANAQASRPYHHRLEHKQGIDSRNDGEEQTLEESVGPQYHGPLPRPPMSIYHPHNQLQGNIATGSPESGQRSLDYRLYREHIRLSSYLQRENGTHTGHQVPVQENRPAPQTIHDAGDRYDPYARPARLRRARRATHLPVDAVTEMQGYTGDSHNMEHHTVDTISKVSVPQIANTGANEDGIGPGDRFLEGIQGPLIHSSLGSIEVQDNMEGQGYSMAPLHLTQPDGSIWTRKQ